MKYEFPVESRYAQAVIFNRVDTDVFCVTLVTRDAGSAEDVLKKIEAYRMAAEGDGQFRGYFSMSQEGRELTFVGNISNLILLLQPRPILPQSFFAQISQHAEVQAWLEASTKCQRQDQASIDMLAFKIIMAIHDLPGDARAAGLSRLQERLAGESAKYKEPLAGESHHATPPGLFSHGGV